MVHTVQGEEEAPPTVVAPEMILMSYKVIDHVLGRVSVVQTLGLRVPRPRTLTIAVESKGGIQVMIEPHVDPGGLRRKQAVPRHTVRTGRVHIPIVCRMDIESKPV
jgi:hypothetical protein